LSLLSLNLLAPLFVRPIDKRTGQVQPYAAFEWAEPASEVLDWDVRRPRLLKLLLESKADVICLQEVQFERTGSEFAIPQWLCLDGYDVRVPGQSYLEQMAERNQRVLDHEIAIGCAILYRKDRLEIVGEVDSVNSPNTLVSICLQGLPTSPLAALGPTAVFSVHLDAQAEVKRVEQLTKCLGYARQFRTREAIFAGDMNTEVLEGSCITAFLSDVATPSEDAFQRECANALRLSNAEGGDEEEGPTKVETGASNDDGFCPTEAQLGEWKELFNRASEASKSQRIQLRRAPTGPTRAAYDHGKTSGPCRTWRLDHIFFSAGTLELQSLWESLESDPDSSDSGLPNRIIPSDHHPVAATFKPSPAAALDEVAKCKLLEDLEKLEQEQAAAREELEQTLKAAEPKPPEPAPSAPEEEGKKKKKGGKERPSPEMVAHIQESRRQTRELKEVQANRRKDFVAGLNDLQLDVLEGSLALPAWLETGVRK